MALYISTVTRTIPSAERKPVGNANTAGAAFYISPPDKSLGQTGTYVTYTTYTIDPATGDEVQNAQSFVAPDRMIAGHNMAGSSEPRCSLYSLRSHFIDKVRAGADRAWADAYWAKVVTLAQALHIDVDVDAVLDAMMGATKPTTAAKTMPTVVRGKAAKPAAKPAAKATRVEEDQPFA